MQTHAELCRDIFRKGSKTYYYSSLWFPESVRADVFTLYSFVRTADDFVDSIPARPEEFYAFRAEYERAADGHSTLNPVIEGFIELSNRKQFERGWVTAFLDAMAQDIAPYSYETIDDTINYMYGSAEVVGLMMGAILDLDPASRDAARMLGRAMQYINFIRDVEEDVQLGRCYFPRVELERFGLSDLTAETARTNPEAFAQFVRAQVDRYMHWQDLAEQGFRYIRRRYLIPIKTASELYKWTAQSIAADPPIVHRKKLKPSVYRVMHYAAFNSVALALP